MAKKLLVIIPQREPAEHPLPDGRWQLGSHPSGDICIDYQNEVARRAAVVEVRGEIVFLENLNDFPIYVGQRELPAAGRTEWAATETVLLARSVSLQWQSAAEEDVESVTGHPLRRTLTQLAVIVVCLASSVYMLYWDRQSADSPVDTTRTENLRELVEAITVAVGPAANRGTEAATMAIRDLPEEHQTILQYLTDAAVADARWGKTRMDKIRAIEAYNRVLNYQPIQQATPDSVEQRVRHYVESRLASLSD